MLRNISRKLAKLCDLQQITNRGIFTTSLLKDESKENLSETNEPDTVKIEKDGNITLIGINRPNQRNAVNAETADKLTSAFLAFEDDPTSPVGVLYGVGGSFCSGYDIVEIALKGDNASTDILMGADGSVGPTRRHMKKPVICSIKGFCVANGLELALLCDLRVMEESAILGFFNRRFGVPVIDGGTARLPRMVGFSRALDLILTGRQVTAKEAFDMGLANRIVATGTSLGQSLNLAYSIAKFPQAALNHDRNSLYESTYDAPSFNQAIQNEIMNTSKDVIEEMQVGIREFNKGHIHAASAENLRGKSMADWEKQEVKIEKENKSAKKN